MADIKIKKKGETAIKTLDRTAIIGDKFKGNIVNIKDKTKESYEENENSGQEYAENKIQNKTRNTIQYGTYKGNQTGVKNVKRTKENIVKGKKQAIKIKQKIHNAKEIKKAGKNTVKTANKTIKATKKTIKTAKTTAKASKEAVKTSVKMAQKTAQMTKATIKATVQAIKIAVKVTIATVKAIIAATKALVSAIIAGGWVAVLIIVIIVLIAMICGSIYGIFFASEDTGSTITVGQTQEVTTMNKVISDLNIEFMNKITQIQNENEHTDYDINSNKASWQDVLAIYSVKLNGGDNQNEVLTIDDEKVKILKEIFGEMNKVEFSIENKTEEKTEIHLTHTERVIINKKILHITINGKSVEEMAEKYNFNKKQMEQLKELTNEKYASMWSSVIYGSSIGSNDIVQVAISQIGNVGGQPYWSWYGFKSREEWCACFVSWCANECGYIEKGVIPKFAGCGVGVDWFKVCELWRERGFIPKSRRYYIF